MRIIILIRSSFLNTAGFFEFVVYEREYDRIEAFKGVLRICQAKYSLGRVIMSYEILIIVIFMVLKYNKPTYSTYGDSKILFTFALYRGGKLQ